MNAGIKVALLIRVCWGVVVLFGILGMLIGKPFALTILLVSASVWTIMKIVIEAADALATLRKPSGPSSKDDGSIPRSPGSK